MCLVWLPVAWVIGCPGIPGLPFGWSPLSAVYPIAPSFPGPEDAGSKPALLSPAEDREDPGTPRLPENGAVPGQLGDSE